MGARPTPSSGVLGSRPRAGHWEAALGEQGAPPWTCQSSSAIQKENLLATEDTEPNPWTLMAPRRVLQAAAVMAATIPSAWAQQQGTQQREEHPQIRLEECSGTHCTHNWGSVVLDANWRWIDKEGKNCYKNDNTWDSEYCPNPRDCALNCAVEGADYAGTYGVTPNRNRDGLVLKFVTKSRYSTNYGSRLYVMDSDDTYKSYYLKNREFTMTVDVSQLPCGLNGAVYFVEMDKKGGWDGRSNTAGAKYGTGYCDAQCPHDMKFINGEANLREWNATAVPPVGYHGACCAEMDIWEANSKATAYTPHPCSKPGLTKCEGVECGDNKKGQRYDGICDKDGCDYNHYRLGERSFYGMGNFDVDTGKPITLVTQFLTHDGSDTGDLSEIRRFYVQDGKVIPNSEASILGPKAGNSVTDGFCDKQKRVFGDVNDFQRKGGMAEMGKALDRGMVLVLSLWDDTDVSMQWLDAAYPTDQPREKPGVLRGPCPGGHQSSPEYVRKTYPHAQVEFSQIKVGTIGSTFQHGRRLESFV